MDSALIFWAIGRKIMKNPFQKGRYPPATNLVAHPSSRICFWSNGSTTTSHKACFSRLSDLAVRIYILIALGTRILQFSSSCEPNTDSSSNSACLSCSCLISTHQNKELRKRAAEVLSDLAVGYFVLSVGSSNTPIQLIMRAIQSFFLPQGRKGYGTP